MTRLYSDCASLMSFSRSCCAWFTSLNEGFTGSGGVDVLQDDLLDLHAHLVLIGESLQLLFDEVGDLLAGRS